MRRPAREAPGAETEQKFMETETSDPAGLPSSPPFETEELRRALGCFATGVTIVTTLGPREEPLGITASSFNSVSLAPPLVLFGARKETYSLPAFLSANSFAVNVLTAEQQELSARFANSGKDKWRNVEYARVRGNGCPYFPNALAVFECRIHDTYEGGDHVIFIGRVQSFLANPERPPLLHYQGYYALMQPPRRPGHG